MKRKIGESNYTTSSGAVYHGRGRVSAGCFQSPEMIEFCWLQHIKLAFS